jgi:putative addiction module killer protein
MYLIKQTEVFRKWLRKLKDVKAKVSILRRVERMKIGNFGDCKFLGDNISELRLSIGPGYRIYYTLFESEIIILLVGGDKSTQAADIEKAKKLAKEYKNEE